MFGQCVESCIKQQWCYSSQTKLTFHQLQIYAGSNSPDIDESSDGATTADAALSIEDDGGADDADHCASCLGTFVTGDAIASSDQCCHVFHQACISDWVLRNNHCPCCRRKFSTRKRPEQVPKEELHTNTGAPQNTADNDEIDV